MIHQLTQRLHTIIKRTRHHLGTQHPRQFLTIALSLQLLVMCYICVQLNVWQNPLPQPSDRLSNSNQNTTGYFLKPTAPSLAQRETIDFLNHFGHFKTFHDVALRKYQWRGHHIIAQITSQQPATLTPLLKFLHSKSSHCLLNRISKQPHQPLQAELSCQSTEQLTHQGTLP